MRVEHHANEADLLRHAGEWLERAEAQHALILGTCAAPPPRVAEPPLWLSVNEAGTPEAVAIRTPPFKLVLSRAPRDALTALVLDLATGDSALPGVVGPVDTAREFAELWGRARSVRAKVTVRQGIYELTQVIPPSPCAPGALRPARPSDTARIGEWVSGFATDASVPATEGADLQRRAGDAVANGTLFVWDDAGEAVSMAVLQGPTRRGVRVSLVYTPPERRGRGYASACVAALSAHALAAGRSFCMLYTDLANPMSNAIYQRVGYRLIGESVMFAFK